MGCYSKITETRWLVNNRNLCLMVPKAGKSTLAILVFGEAIDHHLPTVTSPGGRDNGSFSASYEDTLFIHDGRDPMT